MVLDKYNIPNFMCILKDNISRLKTFDFLLRVCNRNMRFAVGHDMIPRLEIV